MTRQEEIGAQCLGQGHFDTDSQVARNRSRNRLILGRPLHQVKLMYDEKYLCLSLWLGDEYSNLNMGDNNFLVDRQSLCAGYHLVEK